MSQAQQVPGTCCPISLGLILKPSCGVNWWKWIVGRNVEVQIGVSGNLSEVQHCCGSIIVGVGSNRSTTLNCRTKRELKKNGWVLNIAKCNLWHSPAAGGQGRQMRVWMRSRRRLRHRGFWWSCCWDTGSDMHSSAEALLRRRQRSPGRSCSPPA